MTTKIQDKLETTFLLKSKDKEPPPFLLEVVQVRLFLGGDTVKDTL